MSFFNLYSQVHESSMDSASWLLRCRGLHSSAHHGFSLAASNASSQRKPVHFKAPPSNQPLPRFYSNAPPQLPRLPVQPLHKTLSTLSQVLQPLLTIEEMNDVDQMLIDFARPDGNGVKLQKFLEDRAATTENWLSEWWLDAAYLAGRSPCPITTSPGLSWPHFDWHGQDQQIHFCSLLTSAVLNFKHLIDTNTLPQDFAGKAPLDMTQYKLVFGTTRVPGLGMDRMMFGKDYDPTTARHCVVARKGHLFKVPVYDVNGQPLHHEQLRKQILACLTECEQKKPVEEQVGLLTTENRDTWARAYEKLKAVPSNAASLSELERALFILCLDEPSSARRPDYNEMDEQMMQCLHGGGPRSNSGNRWYDKCLQFIVAPNGYAGMTYEHSPAEGPAVASLMDYVMDKLESKQFQTTLAEGEIEPPSKLRFTLDDADRKTIHNAADTWQRAADDISLRVFKFAHYGKNFPKQMKMSPDSFIQLAMHLAYFKIHHACPPTYETGTLRTFHLGRTDTIRLPSSDSVKFCQRMCSPNTTGARKAQILTQAVEAHRKYMLQVAQGAGVDRHMLGFKLAAGELGVEWPALLKSPLLQRMSHFQVSTSQVPTKHDICLAFGPSTSDCYGVCYNPKETNITFTISAFNHHPNTSVSRFKNALNESLLDMHACLVESATLKAKL